MLALPAPHLSVQRSRGRPLGQCPVSELPGVRRWRQEMAELQCPHDIQSFRGLEACLLEDEVDRCPIQISGRCLKPRERQLSNRADLQLAELSCLALGEPSILTGLV